MEVVWSEQAMNSLAAIYDYVHGKSPKDAANLLVKLLELGDSLSNDDVLYSIDPIINKENYRHISLWSYKLIYEIAHNKVIILEVFDGRQNPEKLEKY